MRGKNSGSVPLQYFSRKNSEKSPPYHFLSENLVTDFGNAEMAFADVVGPH